MRYKPESKEEAVLFTGRWCSTCTHLLNNGTCDILTKMMELNVDSEEYPKELGFHPTYEYPFCTDFNIFFLMAPYKFTVGRAAMVSDRLGNAKELILKSKEEVSVRVKRPLAKRIAKAFGANWLPTARKTLILTQRTTMSASGKDLFLNGDRDEADFLIKHYKSKRKKGLPEKKD